METFKCSCGFAGCTTVIDVEQDTWDIENNSGILITVSSRNGIKPTNANIYLDADAARALILGITNLLLGKGATNG